LRKTKWAGLRVKQKISRLLRFSRHVFHGFAFAVFQQRPVFSNLPLLCLSKCRFFRICVCCASANAGFFRLGFAVLQQMPVFSDWGLLCFSRRKFLRRLLMLRESGGEFHFWLK
jgi:hypothetical protein